MERITLNQLAFADDIVLLTNKEKDLQHNLQIWKGKLLKHGYRINIEKSKVMTIVTTQKKIQIKIEQEDIKQVKLFK